MKKKKLDKIIRNNKVINGNYNVRFENRLGVEKICHDKIDA